MFKSRFFIIVSLITVLPALIFAALAIFLYSYSKNNIDFRADEEMFLAARCSNVTKLYYDAGGYNSAGDYDPVEYATVSGATEKKSFVKYESISENVKLAFLAAEDREFFDHSGVNVRRTVMAALNYILNRSDRFGGSTITQQVIKNISGDKEKTVKRKIEEIIRAYNIEHSHSKKEIFEVYLNIIPMGEGVCGVSLASQLYFGKDVNDLEVEEAALLAAITNAPTRNNPYNNYGAAIKKRNAVLFAMYECGYITEEEYTSAKESLIVLEERSEAKNSLSSWFTETVCDTVVKDLQRELGYTEGAAKMLVYSGGLSIYTTVDPKIQAIMEERFKSGEYSFGEGYAGPQYSMVVCDSKSGSVRGIIGGAGEKRANKVFNHALTPHVPGSTLKPLALYAPLIDKKEITWSTVFDDIPKEVHQDEGGILRAYPKNSPDEYAGLICTADAIAYSKNTVAIELYNRLGKEAVFENLYNKYRFKTLVKREEKNGKVYTDIAESPLAYGQLTYGVPLVDLTGAYTSFASGGILQKARCYLKCYDGNGDLIIDNTADATRVFSSDCAKVMQKLLSGVVEYGTASSIRLKKIVNTAGKTGTSGANLDKLFVGFTPYYTAGIWCGFDDGKSAVYGTNHLKIWDDVMIRIHENTLSNVDIPESFSTGGLVRSAFCKDSGELYSPECLLDVRQNRLGYGYFIKGTEPRHNCSVHKVVRIDDKTGEILHPFDIMYRYGMNVAFLDIKKRGIQGDVHIADEEYILPEEYKNRFGMRKLFFGF